MHHIIVNPVAGKGRSLKILPKLETLFKMNEMPYETYSTTAALDAYNIAQEIIKSTSDGIIGIGGDGTIQEIVAGIAAGSDHQTGIQIPLGIMPCGSGNDFALTFNGRKNKKAAIYEPDSMVARFFDGIKNKKTRTVDVIKAGGMAYINIANMGLDTRIVQNALRYKKRFGQYAYLAAVYKTILHHQNLELTIKVNGETISSAFTLAAVCNGQYYGGGMRIAPGAKPDDGKITLCLVDGMHKIKTMFIFPLLLLQWHTRLKAVRYIECERFSIKWNDTETLCLDGNLYERTSPLVFEIMPGALKVFM